MNTEKKLSFYPYANTSVILKLNEQENGIAVKIDQQIRILRHVVQEYNCKKMNCRVLIKIINEFNEGKNLFLSNVMKKINLYPYFITQ